MMFAAHCDPALSTLATGRGGANLVSRLRLKSISPVPSSTLSLTAKLGDTLGT